MLQRHPAALSLSIAVSLLLGCGPGSTASAQATPTALTRPAAAVAATPQAALPAAKSSPPAVSAPVAARVASPAARVSAAPRAKLGPGSPAIGVQRVAGIDQAPTYVTHAGDASGRMFVVGKRGQIFIMRNGGIAPTPFLDISGIVNSSGSEQGLLSVAFHPSYATNGLFYVNYTDRNGIGNTVVARYRVSADNPDRADQNSGTTLLTIEQPAQNHNGGLITFGPDGYLYIGMGDGGRADDPWGNAQNKGVLLGKLLRIDVNNGDPYAIPSDNPLVNDPSARPEIWAYGLRNPWRFSFDRASGDLYIADVGQNRWEWVHFQPAGQGGQNYGWDVVEGSHCHEPSQGCDTSPFPAPIAEYGHSNGNLSITGGYVYRGPSFPALSGLYFYADYGSGRIWAAQQEAPGSWHSEELLNSGMRISSFGEDEAGDLYLASMSDNSVYRLVAP